MPQRQENAVISAVVERAENGWRDNVTHMRYSEVDCGTGLPQWQRIVGNAAVVEGTGEVMWSRESVAMV